MKWSAAENSGEVRSRIQDERDWGFGSALLVDMLWGAITGLVAGPATAAAVTRAAGGSYEQKMNRSGPVVTEKRSGELGKDLASGCCRINGNRLTDLRADELENAIDSVAVHGAFALFNQVQQLEVVVSSALLSAHLL